jgi:hypothetical protein
VEQFYFACLFDHPLIGKDDGWKKFLTSPGEDLALRPAPDRRPGPSKDVA